MCEPLHAAVPTPGALKRWDEVPWAAHVPARAYRRSLLWTTKQCVSSPVCGAMAHLYLTKLQRAWVHLVLHCASA